MTAEESLAASSASSDLPRADASDLSPADASVADTSATDASSAEHREREALAWLYSFSDWERGVGWSKDSSPEEVWKLGRTRALLDLAGAPDHDLRIAHVAGTKGKGSTVAYLEAIVRAARWRTVAYTQPHLHTFRERIKIDGQPFDPERFAAGVDRLRGLVDRLAEQHPEAGAPTTFELTTALAVLVAAEAKADLLIAEVGLGGRLDATNALDTDLAIIARIGLDHRQILGNTLAEIAAEKVAIARPGQTVLSAVQRPPARDVIARYCAEIGANLRVVRPLTARRAAGHHGEVAGRLTNDLPFRARLAMATSDEHVGMHHRQNAALAVAAAEALLTVGHRLITTAVSKGLSAAWLPARHELVRLHPRIMIDAAHNVDSARALADALSADSLSADALNADSHSADSHSAAPPSATSGRPLWLVLGILRDKDARAILRVLLPLADGVVTVTPTSPRALPADALAAACRELSAIPVEQAPSVRAALDLARSRVGQDGSIAVAGSFATASEARAVLGLADVVTSEAHQAWLAAGGLTSA